LQIGRIEFFLPVDDLLSYFFILTNGSDVLLKLSFLFLVSYFVCYSHNEQTFCWLWYASNSDAEITAAFCMHLCKYFTVLLQQLFLYVLQNCNFTILVIIVLMSSI